MGLQMLKRWGNDSKRDRVGSVAITQIARLPIIHIRNHIIIRETRDKNNGQNNSLYYSITHVGSYIHQIEPSSYLLNILLIPLQNSYGNYLSVHSTDTTDEADLIYNQLANQSSGLTDQLLQHLLYRFPLIFNNKSSFFSRDMIMIF